MEICKALQAFPLQFLARFTGVGENPCAPLYVPGKQDKHAMAPPVLNLPVGQFVHAVAAVYPVPVPNVPAVHSRQAVDPTADT